jgi:hypothetical protein
MARGRMIDAWNQTSLLAALLSQDATQADYHPFADELTQPPQIMEHNEALLEQIQASGLFR